MRKLTLHWLAFIVCLSLSFKLSVTDCFAQSAEKGEPLPKSVPLPHPFSRFSAAQVLKQIFADYNSKTGQVASIPDSLVRIGKARLWKAQGEERLVVLVEIGDQQSLSSTNLCGNCGAYALLAVLKQNGGALRLVAKQQNPPLEGKEANAYQAMMYTGHDQITLDLAPYQLNRRETLIGLRMEHIWIPAHSWSMLLMLYRIEGEQLREVFSEMVVEREYPDGLGERAVIKTVSTISPQLSKSGFYDLRIDKTSLHCVDKGEDWDCNLKRDRIKRISKQREWWRFGGEKFVQVKR